MNKTLLLFIVLVLSVNLVEGVGLSVAPGTILIEDFPVGDFYDFQEERNYTIRIRNGDDTPHTYTLKAERPSESESRATGFYDIPYPEWFYLEVETVTVAAGEEENVRMFMEIPEDQGWYNHHWLLGISALPIPDPEIPGGSISLGAYLLYRFETEADAKAVPTVGHNELVIVPSTLIFNDVVPGELYQKQVKIYHPFRTGKKCYVESLDPASDVAKWTILPSPGYPRLQNSEWIAYDSSLVLSPDQPSTFDIFLQTPPTDLTKTHEILLFMPQGTGTKSFLRVKINFKVNKSGN